MGGGEFMSKIVLTRIDDRLIHGQVMTAWLNYTGANRIIIVDDLVAKDEFIISILKMAVPAGIKVNIYDIATAATKLQEENDSNDKIIILVKTPQTIYALLEKGVEIESINIGGMGAMPGRKKFYRNISASEEEKELFKKIIEKGVDVGIRIIPDNNEVKVDRIL